MPATDILQTNAFGARESFEGHRCHNHLHHHDTIWRSGSPTIPTTTSSAAAVSGAAFANYFRQERQRWLQEYSRHMIIGGASSQNESVIKSLEQRIKHQIVQRWKTMTEADRQVYERSPKLRQPRNFLPGRVGPERLVSIDWSKQQPPAQEPTSHTVTAATNSSNNHHHHHHHQLQHRMIVRKDSVASTTSSVDSRDYSKPTSSSSNTTHTPSSSVSFPKHSLKKPRMVIIPPPPTDQRLPSTVLVFDHSKTAASAGTTGTRSPTTTATATLTPLGAPPTMALQQHQQLPFPVSNLFSPTNLAAPSLQPSRHHHHQQQDSFTFDEFILEALDGMAEE